MKPRRKLKLVAPTIWTINGIEYCVKVVPLAEYINGNITWRRTIVLTPKSGTDANSE